MTNSFGQPFVASDALNVGHIPARATNWRAVIEFAATLDMQSEPASTYITGVADITDDSTIVDMRHALYAEWRRWNHIGRDADAKTVSQTQTVLDALRARCA